MCCIQVAVLCISWLKLILCFSVITLLHCVFSMHSFKDISYLNLYKGIIEATSYSLACGSYSN
jgi:hypothetical protein